MKASGFAKLSPKQKLALLKKLRGQRICLDYQYFPHLGSLEARASGVLRVRRVFSQVSVYINDLPFRLEGIKEIYLLAKNEEAPKINQSPVPVK